MPCLELQVQIETWHKGQKYLAFGNIKRSPRKNSMGPKVWHEHSICSIRIATKIFSFNKQKGCLKKSTSFF